MSQLRFILLLLVLYCLAGRLPVWAEEYHPPIPGSPASLTDWRWLARPLVGKQTVIAALRDPQRLAPAPEGGFLVVKLDGPGVLDHFATTDGSATVAIEVDGQRLWGGKIDSLLAASKSDANALFPTPLFCAGGPLRHLLAPIGFRTALRITADRPTFSRYLVYRQFPPGTTVMPATADPAGAYAHQLTTAAKVWQQGFVDFRRQPLAPAESLRNELLLPARSRVTALECTGSGEITHLEFHLNPALTGSLREMLVEITYDGAAAPAVRLPLTDFVGLPHPWATGRWCAALGTLAGGVRFPWFIQTPRVHYPEVTLHANLPLPFATGLRIVLVNRAADVRFTGYLIAVREPLSLAEALAAGRLCGTRLLAPITAGADPIPLIHIPGPGQFVGLGLFLTGNQFWPPAAENSKVLLQADAQPSLTGPGVLPIWLMGAYRGPQTGVPIWEHPRLEDQYAGVMRHFLTDPVPFSTQATFAYTPGVDDRGAPTQATVIALWYRFNVLPYAAPAQPEHAEALPYSDYGAGNGVNHTLMPWSNGADSRQVWCKDADALAPVAVAHGGEIRLIEDVAHNYHPQHGRYLQITADQPGDYVDFLLPMPPNRYLAAGTVALWGPNRAQYEMDILAKDDAQSPPSFPQSLEFYHDRAVGGVAMKAPMMTGSSLQHHRDSSTEYPVPFRNPAPDNDGVIRFICQTKALDCTVYQMKCDQLRLDIPPPTPAGWHEFEDGLLPATSGDLLAWLPKYGRFAWSGWGALQLASLAGGKAVIHALQLTGPSTPSELHLKGCLDPQKGGWSVSLNGAPTIALHPGSDDREIVEWVIPLHGQPLPKELTFEFSCTASGPPAERTNVPTRAELALDAWWVK